MRPVLLLLLLLFAAVQAAAQGWTVDAARELLSAIEGAAAHGLEPEDYGRGRLALALASADPSAALFVAPDSFRRLATDYSEGRLGRAPRAGWRMAGQEMYPARLDALEREALGGAGVRQVLERLLPPFPQYRLLVAAHAATPASDRERRDLLRVNLERWRWMPRQPGEAHILVNVAAQELYHVRPGAEPVRHRVIVGRPRTPTLQFTAAATGVVLNPPWVVPRSIIRESVGALIRSSPATARARGYSWTGSGGSLSVTQAPGPQNALGHVKIDMPNPYSIFLHDTPNRGLFNRKERTLSHGCIRTEDVRGLAARMLEEVPGWDMGRIDAVIETRKTTVVPLARPLPLHVGYFTAEIGPDAALIRHPDVYDRDAAILAALDGRSAAAPGAETVAETDCRQPARS